MRPVPVFALACLAAAASARAVPDLGARLEHYAYPHPVHVQCIEQQGKALEMAYMDLAPDAPNGKTAVLLHGKNFCGPYWDDTAGFLRAKGYRVVIPDQIGFCKSSRPLDIQYSLAQLAANTHALLTSLGVERATVIAHSMGGMIGVRHALLYPDATERLVLVNPIGLEDWQAAGVPWRSVDDWYRQELRTDAESIRAYQRKAYYDGEWQPAYDRWVNLQAGMYGPGGRETTAWASALAYDMIFNQPVVHELDRIRVATVLVIGQRDRTAIGRDRAPPEVSARIGDYPALGRAAARAIRDARLIELEGLGHAPMLEAPRRFRSALADALDIRDGAPAKSR